MSGISDMFWKFDLHSTSHLEALLDKDDVTLTELMDEEDVLQECKAQNRRLVQFFLPYYIITASVVSDIPGVMFVTCASFHIMMAV